nr:type IX secretion system sortase PorU [Bacteroidales bacterium]
MKKLLGYILLMLSAFTASAVELTWYVDAQHIWHFEEGSLDEGGLSMYYEQFQDADKISGIGIQFPVFEEIKGNELRAMLPLLKNLPLSDSLQLQVKQSRYRKQKHWDVGFYPYICRDKKYYRLSSFEWKIQQESPLLWQRDDYASRASFIAENESAQREAASRYASQSVMREGKWQKISVTKNGIYSLSYKDLEKMGFDPDKVQVYGYGGHLLEENFGKTERPYFDDLPKVAMYRNDKQGYLLFYAKGLQRWVYDAALGMFVRELNHYSNEAFYFLGETSDAQCLMQHAPEAGEADKISRHYTEFILHENDWTNLGLTGRECYGESFVSAAQQTFSFDLGPHYVKEENASLLVEFVARNTASSTCVINLNNKHIGNLNFNGIPLSDNYTYGTLQRLHKKFNNEEAQLNINLQYRNGGSTPKAAYLDKITLNVRKKLNGDAAVLLFRDPQSVTPGSCVEYRIANASDEAIVLDLSNDQYPQIVPTYWQEGELCFRASAESLKEFALVDLTANLPSPKKQGKVANQNLHGLGAQDLVIIAHSDFMQEAESLAQAHRQYSHLRCVVLDAEQVYNEFSSGTPDATAYRRLMKMFYDRAATDEDLPKSLLLFGDAVFDNRLKTNGLNYNSSRPNKLLCYQSKESLIGTQSYVSDDYFAFLDDNEGAILPQDKMDIGVGRFPVRTKQEAQTAINKSINYLKNKDKGPWKNAVCFLGDDLDNNTHTEHADALADIVRLSHPEFTINKIYVDAFNRENAASGSKTPDANRRFKQLLSQGLLMLNYSGHGSTTAWTEEGLLSITDIKEMKNTRLPLWVTATCDFCRYDDISTSGGEQVFLNENGGAIAMVTTSRVVYSEPNFRLNKAFIQEVFKKEKGERLSLGEIMCHTKQSSSLYNDRNKLNFALIGDPALKLCYPDYQIEITSIDSIPVDASKPSTLKALSLVSMQGRILDSQGNLAENFDGIIYPSVYDCEETAYTLGNNGNDVFPYSERNKILYSGKASVKQGYFDFSFIMPKDLSYSNKSGLVNLYAHSLDGNTEAQGVFEDFIVGGSNNDAAKDSIGPSIRLFLNDTLFCDGGNTNLNPTLIAFLQDSSGLNTSGNSIGHDLMLSIDGEQKFNLNQYYESDIDSYVSGKLSFNLPELTEGYHQLTLKAWDMQNNSNQASLSFYVKKNEPSKLFDIVFEQNQESAAFIFTHNRPQVWMNAELRVYDLSGRLQWQSNQSMINKDNHGERIEWNYIGLNGLRIENGLYICHLIVQTNGKEEAVISRKIVVGAK